MFLDSKRDARTTFEAAIARSGEVIAPAMEATELSVSGVRSLDTSYYGSVSLLIARSRSGMHLDVARWS